MTSKLAFTLLVRWRPRPRSKRNLKVTKLVFCHLNYGANITVTQMRLCDLYKTTALVLAHFLSVMLSLDHYAILAFQFNNKYYIIFIVNCQEKKYSWTYVYDTGSVTKYTANLLFSIIKNTDSYGRVTYGFKGDCYYFMSSSLQNKIEFYMAIILCF